MTAYPKISVIVPMYNASRTIGDCIKSILNLDYKDFEVIVVNDASTDDSVLKIASLPCKLVNLSRNSGPGVARNKGVDAASGEIIAFTDADCRVPRDWLNNIVKDFFNHQIGAAAGGYSRSDNPGAMAKFQFYDTGFRQRNIPEYLDTCVTSNFACRKEMFLEIGGFPSLRINEDMEFGMALSKRCRIMWNKDNGVSHYFDNSMRHYFFEQILWAESVVKLYLSDPGTVGKKNTYAKSEIFIHLFLTSLLYLCLFGIIFKPPAALMFFCIVAAVYAIINIQFIRFAAKSEGYLFSFKLMPFLLLRNTTWILGVIKAIFKHSLLVLRQLNLFGKKGKRQ